MFYGYKRMKYLVLLFTLFMVSNVKASLQENLEYQRNASRSFIQETVYGVPTNKVEPPDFSLDDLPLRENTEDVSGAIPYDKYRTDYGRYAKQKGFQWDEPFSDESLYVLSMYVAKFIGMAIPWVILFFYTKKIYFLQTKKSREKEY